jgi:hypothetical protein
VKDRKRGGQREGKIEREGAEKEIVRERKEEIKREKDGKREG